MVQVCGGRVSPNGLLETAHGPDLIGEEKLESNKGLYGNPSRQRLHFKSSLACQGPAYITLHPLVHSSPTPLPFLYVAVFSLLVPMCTSLHPRSGSQKLTADVVEQRDMERRNSKPEFWS